MTAGWRERIVGTPGTLGGKARIKDTRISVEFVLELMHNGWTVSEILDEYPFLTENDLSACLDYARELVADLPLNL